MTDFLTRIARHALGLTPSAKLLGAVRYAPDDIPPTEGYENDASAAHAPATPAPRRPRAAVAAPPHIDNAPVPQRGAMPNRAADVIANTPDVIANTPRVADTLDAAASAPGVIPSDGEGPARAMRDRPSEEPRTALPRPPVPATPLPAAAARERERIPRPETAPEHAVFETHTTIATRDVIDDKPDAPTPTAERQRERTPMPLQTQRAEQRTERIEPNDHLERTERLERIERAERIAAHDGEPPAVHVTIGRIEVRTAAPPSPPPAAPPAPAPRLSLDEYLRQQNGRRQ
jgi:hypothetical protein